VDELAGNADAVARLAHTTFQHVAHAEVATDLLHIDRLALVGEGRVACDYMQLSRCRNFKPLTKRSSRRWIPTKMAPSLSRRCKPSCGAPVNRILSTSTKIASHRCLFNLPRACEVGK